MPGRDDTLEDVMDQLCTCGHTLGVHHTLDESCCEHGCECDAFQGVNAEFGNGQPTEEQIQAQFEAHSQQIAENVRDLTADLPGGEGRIGEIKNELDQILDAALLCDDSNCRHRRDRHHTTEREGDTDCAVHDCVCVGFLEPKSTEPETLAVPSFLRADALRKPTRNSNTHETADDLWSHDAHARAIDKDRAAELGAMTDEQRTESDAVQAETLDNLCTCGHRYGDHAANYGELCLLAVCECVKFEALLKPVAMTDTLLPDDVRPTDEQVAAFVTGVPTEELNSVDLEYVHDSPIDPEAIARATRGPADVQVGNLEERPFRNTCCQKCGHEAEDHAANGTVCHVKGCDCEALVEYTGGINPEDVEAGIFAGLKRYRDDPGTDPRKPYTPPLLRKKYIGEAELRKILAEAGRLDLLEEIPEGQVDRVTVNHDAEHWHEIERLARNPQGSSETNTARDRTIKAIALSLLELRQCLGVSIEHAQMLSVIERNTKAIQKTVEALDLLVDRVTGEGSP